MLRRCLLGPYYSSMMFTVSFRAYPFGHLEGRVSCHRSQLYRVVAEKPTNRGDLLVVESDGFARSSFTGPSMLQEARYAHDLTVQCLTL